VPETIFIKCPKDLQFLQPFECSELSRVGNASDGGYLLPRPYIDRIQHLISFGLGENWSFESELASLNPNLSIHVYDNTVSLQFFATKAIKGIVKFLMGKESFSNVISRIRRLVTYFRFWIFNRKNKHLHLRISQESFHSISGAINQDSSYGIKIDIEGSEWEILRDLETVQNSFEFMILEIHDFDNHVNELNEFLTAIQASYKLIHLHANNFGDIGKKGFPNVFEIVLIRDRGLVNLTNKRQHLPISGFDIPNAKNRPDYQIEF
jgi:hypothetical protein